MSERTKSELLVDRLLGQLVGAAAVLGLYGGSHPRTVAALQLIDLQLQRLLSEQAELAFVVLGQELFVQGQPFSRISRHAGPLVRKLRRLGVEYVTVRAGVRLDELAGFIEDLAGRGQTEVRSRPHIQVGEIALSERELGGPDDRASGDQGRPQGAVRDRVAVVRDCLANFTAGHELEVDDLIRIARAILDAIVADPDPIRHFAPWEGAELWPAVHAHNVAVLTTALAHRAGVGREVCTDLGVAALVHDVGKLSLPAELTARELELAGDELELILDHPQDGLAALLATPGLSETALIVAFDHHLNFNGTGAPRLPRPRRPHVAARIVAVADAFVILFTARGGSGHLPPDAMCEWIDERSGKLFDPEWTAALRVILADASTAPPGPSEA